MSLEYYLNGEGPTEFLTLLSACISTAGTDAFNSHFLGMIENVIRADQCTIFSFKTARPTCYLSYNKRKLKSVHNLAQKYLRNGFKNDPLRAEIDQVRTSRQTIVRDLVDLKPNMPPEYLKTFFTSIGVTDKISIIGVNAADLVVLNFYRFEENGAFHRSDSDLRNKFWEAIVRIVLLHYGSTTVSDITSPLHSLSAREKSICTAMLRGMTADAIAWELDISADTVKTYRRRAYEKLGINSKSALFELCHRH